MYTQCPHCQTIFGVSEAHLSAAFGRVRCGQCQGQFNAKRHLLDELPEQIEQDDTVATQSTAVEMPATQTKPADIGADEIEYIDLSNPDKPTEEPGDSLESSQTAVPDDLLATDNDTDLPATTSDTHLEITRLPPQLDERPEKDELDAIFAALDTRLEELSEDADEAIIKPFDKFESHQTASMDYQDAFGNPDSQSAADIKSSIETIFAAAEAELDKSPIAEANEDTDTKAHSQDSSETVTDIELPADDFLHIEPSIEETFIAKAETESTSENIEPDTENEPPTPSDNNDNDEATSEPVHDETKTSDFEQEEFPFLLHDDLMAEQIPPRPWQKTLGLASLITLLLIAISFQLALFRNVELANQLPALKPYLLSFCQHLPCQFSGQRDVKQIQLTSRDVRTHPKGKNTILINAIFVNNARFDQPYPDILLTLSDLTTTVIAQRRFTPQDYLAKATSTFQLMKSGAPVHISLEVLDPGNDAVNFQFEFL